MSITSTSLTVFESLVVEKQWTTSGKPAENQWTTRGRSDQGGGLSATELLSATCHLDGGAGGLSYWTVFCSLGDDIKEQEQHNH